jgi:hypothetical protein
MKEHRSRYKSLLLIVSICIVALFIPSSRIWSQCIQINDLIEMDTTCPTADFFIQLWYGPTAIMDTPLKNLNAELPFPTIPKIRRCLDYFSGKKWCGCTGFDCFSKKGNDRLSVVLQQRLQLPSKVVSPPPSTKWWRIRFNNPIDIGNIHQDKNSSCYLVSDYPSNRKTWINPNLIISKNGTLVDKIEFGMPPLGSVDKSGQHQICMWEIKMGQEIYHEHFVTDDTCYGWIEVKVTPVVEPVGTPIGAKTWMEERPRGPVNPPAPAPPPVIPK